MISFIRADNKDASQLTQICRASKGFWGYEQTLMDQWHSELTITASYIEENRVMKIFQHSNLVGFFALENHQTFQELGHFWLVPEYIGKGIGTTVLNHIKSKLIPAKQEMHVLADPNAEHFYAKNGFITYEFFQTKIKNRKLPRMKWIG